MTQDKELSGFEQQALLVERQTREMDLVIADFESIREENGRLKD